MLKFARFCPRTTTCSPSWIPNKWLKVVTGKTSRDADIDKVDRRYFEICLFSQAWLELKSGDLFIEGSEKFGDWRNQLISWEEYDTSLETYCQQIGCTKDPSEFIEGLKTWLTETIKEVDANFPENESLSIKDNEPVIRRHAKREKPKGFDTIERLVEQRLPECNILDIISDTEHWLNWTKNFRPISGYDSRLDFPQPRYITTAFCYVRFAQQFSKTKPPEFHDNMRYETFIRCILRCFENLGGVPWVLVFDNTKTVAKGRNDDGNPVWNPKFRQFASEIGFYPEVCALYSPNQKGTVENGVSFVKGNFLPGRTFLDDGELKIQLQHWLSEVNLGKFDTATPAEKKCQTHGRIPAELLSEERKAFEPLVEKSDSYGLLHLRKVSPEAVIRFETNCYSVPEELIRQVVAVRVAEKELRIYYDNQLVAQHQRSFGRKQWIRDLSHYEKTLEQKPRAKVMAYREKLLGRERASIGLYRLRFTVGGIHL